MEESKKQPVVISKQTGLFLDCINKTDELSNGIMHALTQLYCSCYADEVYRDVFYDKIAAIENAIDIYCMYSVRDNEVQRGFICLEETEKKNDN